MTVSVIVSESNINFATTEIEQSVLVTNAPISVSIVESSVASVAIAGITSVAVGISEANLTISIAGSPVQAAIATQNIAMSVPSSNINVSIDNSGQGGGGTWGSITGTLSDQTDLQTALNGKVTDTGDTMTGDLIGTDFVKTRSGTITRAGGYVSQVAKTSGRTLTITRNGSNYITSISDGTRTWTLTRDGSNVITAWSVT